MNYRSKCLMFDELRKIELNITRACSYFLLFGYFSTISGYYALSVILNGTVIIAALFALDINKVIKEYE